MDATDQSFYFENNNTLLLVSNPKRTNSFYTMLTLFLQYAF
jgi:hypothetical protein